MKIIQPKVELLTCLDGDEILWRLERCGRVCYKSEGKSDGTPEGAERFVRGIIRRGHEAVLEHISVTLLFTVDRGVSHEIVRHRLASYCQESTRYCNYGKRQFGKEITVIEPCYWERDSNQYKAWERLCHAAEATYLGLLESGATPEEARAVLPNSLKTDLVMTANLREWRHFLKLRTAPKAHPQMRQAALMALTKLRRLALAVFKDIDAGGTDTVCDGDACDVSRLVEAGGADVSREG